MIRFICIAAICLPPFVSAATPPPIELGTIEKATLEMSSCPFDPSAAGMIVGDYGYFNAEAFQFTRSLRVHVFQKQSFPYDQLVFDTYDDATFAVQIHLLENGEISSVALPADRIVKVHSLDRYARFNMDLQDVKEGSVIDITYSHPGMPTTWKFQGLLPVKHSEITIERSPFMEIRKELTAPKNLVTIHGERLVAENIPAFEPQPYTAYYDDLFYHLNIKTLRIDLPGFSSGNETDWPTVSNFLMNHKYFGVLLQDDKFLNTDAKRILKTNMSDQDRIKEAYYTVQQVNWNKHIDMLAQQADMSAVYASKLGNSAEINLMLVLLLRKLGFDAHPLALCTRGTGWLNPNEASLRPLNYVICYLEVNDLAYFLDATEKYVPFNHLPERCLNGSGLVVNRTEARFVDLTTRWNTTQTTSYDLKLSQDGQLAGTISHHLSGYEACRLRTELDTDTNLMQQIIKNPFPFAPAGLTVTNTTVVNTAQLEEPVHIDYEVQMEGQVGTTGEQLSVNPFFYSRLQENPFKEENRTYPVMPAYPFSEEIKTTISIPDGYRIVKQPEPGILMMPDSSFSFQVNTYATNTRFNLTYRLKVDKTYVESDLCGLLKQLFDQLVAKQTELLILEKKKY